MPCGDLWVLRPARNIRLKNILFFLHFSLCTDKISTELVAHIPDVVILATRDLKDLPAVQHLEGVLMMLDISGE